MITCTSCNTENDDSAEFCVSCGTRLRAAAQPENALTCPSCGTLNPSNAQFCVSCGTPLTASYGVGSEQQTLLSSRPVPAPPPVAAAPDATVLASKLEDAYPAKPAPDATVLASKLEDAYPAKPATPPPPPGAPPPPAAPKKSNRNLIIAIVVIVLVLCCCCVAVIVAWSLLGPAIRSDFDLGWLPLLQMGLL